MPLVPLTVKSAESRGKKRSSLATTALFEKGATAEAWMQFLPGYGVVIACVSKAASQQVVETFDACVTSVSTLFHSVSLLRWGVHLPSIPLDSFWFCVGKHGWTDLLESEVMCLLSEEERVRFAFWPGIPNFPRVAADTPPSQRFALKCDRARRDLCRYGYVLGLCAGGHVSRLQTHFESEGVQGFFRFFNCEADMGVSRSDRRSSKLRVSKLLEAPGRAYEETRTEWEIQESAFVSLQRMAQFNKHLGVLRWLTSVLKVPRLSVQLAMTSGGLLSYTEAEIPGLAECVTFLDWDRHQTNPEDHKDNMTCALLLAFWLQTGNMGRLLDRGSGMLQRLTRAPFDRFLIPEFYKCAAAGGRETFDFLVNECRAIWVSRNPAETLIPPPPMTSEQEESFAEATGLPAPPPPLVVQNLFPFHGSAPSPFDLFRGNFPDVLHFCAAEV
uniref:Uncharacterized protein n=1 Tax=Chromera velia CCMP2878 TaxID=1169474 RepID=A0A0G4F570_9ALVE|eukprot:Cvel_15091.t1-p1 / transcript=Cvel_15091.t1 / gene=Cvel_15091 / organism=Chromera_velia_CCMP2878 / gene_product=hypothetical protein / transcript_product=hypothetical protein / location=Cvel_scaffold1101:13685-15010(+) / protein_length=442 / sequence_SO=supercontig / SO=protein_coding / is_pseudo=false